MKYQTKQNFLNSSKVFHVGIEITIRDSLPIHSEGGGKISRDMKTLKLISVKRKILNIDCGWTVAAGEETAKAFCRRRRRRSVDAITYK